MTKALSTAKPIGVLAHPHRPRTHPVAQQIADSLIARDIHAHVFTDWSADDIREVIRDCQMVIAIGGDGAMLRAARVCAPYEVPVLGINMGQLGFLTEIREPEEWSSAIERVLTGSYRVEERMMLTVTIVRDGQPLYTEEALNDVVISGDVVGRMIALDAFIDEDWTTTYYGDAVVIATATGSTAYALACGGPILPPELKNILIVPAAPHLSLDRPIVLAEGSTVEVRAASTNRTRLMLVTDGIPLYELKSEDRILVRASDHITRFIRLRGPNYFYRSLLDRLEPRVRRADYEHPDTIH